MWGQNTVGLFYSHPEFEYYEAVKTFSNLYFLLDQDDVDPEQFWEIIGELGDGAFGKVVLKLHNFLWTRDKWGQF